MSTAAETPITPVVALTDRELVVAHHAGDVAAFAAMYERHSPRVRRITLRMLGNHHDADEVTQETFLKAFKALPRFNGQYQLGAWLARIAANTSLDHLRARVRSGVVVELPHADQLEHVSGPEELIAGDRGRLGETLLRLQPLHAQALIWRTRDGLSHEEMASKLDLSPGQVKSLLHRARRSFRSSWHRSSGSAHEGHDHPPPGRSRYAQIAR